MKHLFKNAIHDFEHCPACREYDEANTIMEIHDAYGKKMYINAAHASRTERFIPLFTANGKPLTHKVRKPHSREYYEEREMLHPANICRHPITTFTTYHDPIDNQYVDFCHACMPWIDTTPAQLTLF